MPSQTGTKIYVLDANTAFRLTILKLNMRVPEFLFIFFLFHFFFFKQASLSFFLTSQPEQYLDMDFTVTSIYNLIANIISDHLYIQYI